MTRLSLSAPPAGWYPDPGGALEWRAWNGAAWSQLTIPYDAPPNSSDPVGALEFVGALHRLARYGVVAVFAGLGLVVSTLAHWPGSAQPTPAWFATTVSDAGVALLVIGSVYFALGARALEGAWHPAALIPGLNVLWVTGLVYARRGGHPAWTRTLTQGALVALYVAQSHRHPWLGVIPVLVALELWSSLSTLVDELIGPSTLATPRPVT